MRLLFILIVSFLLVAGRCLNLERESSYNLYKDRMRARPIDPSDMNPVLRSLFERVTLDELIKLDERLKKRTSKAALSLMLQSKQDPDHTEEEHSCYAGK